MNVVPASQSSPVSAFISMSWGGRGSILGVLVLTNCCSVVLVPAPFEEYSVSSAQQSAGVSEARTTATPLLSSSSTSPSLVPHGPRPSVRRIAFHTGLAAFPCCTSTWWFHVLHVLALSGTSVRRSNFASLLGISFHFSSGTLHYTRSVQQPWTSPASFWSWWTRSYMSSRFRRHSLRNERGYVLDVDLANVLGVVVVKLKQGLLVLTCWSYSRYFFTRLFRRLLSGPHSVVFVPEASLLFELQGVPHFGSWTSRVSVK